MKKYALLVPVLFLSFNVVFAQDYFIPVPGGLESVQEAKDYYLVDMEGKDSLQIYHALLVMAKEVFSGSEDEILETTEGSYIRARGVSKRGLCTYYDMQIEVEFKIKNGRYIFMISKLNMETAESSNGKTKRLLLQKGSNLLRDDLDTEYMFNMKGKPNLRNKQCYKDLVKLLDLLGDAFDISDDFEKYNKIVKDEDSGW